MGLTSKTNAQSSAVDYVLISIGLKNDTEQSFPTNELEFLKYLDIRFYVLSHLVRLLEDAVEHRSKKIRFASGVCHLLLDALPEVLEDQCNPETKDPKQTSSSNKEIGEYFFENVSDAGLAKQMKRRATHRKLFARCWTLFLQLDVHASASARTGARVGGRRARFWPPRGARVFRRIPLQAARARTPDARGLALACRLRLRPGDASPPMRAARSQPSLLVDARAQLGIP
jgi:hypothetical protein